MGKKRKGGYEDQDEEQDQPSSSPPIQPTQPTQNGANQQQQQQQQQNQKSRLDQLIELIQSPSSSGPMKRLAAVQIGEVVACFSEEAASVLVRIRELLYDKKWECRVAAGYAIAAIADVTPPFSSSPNDAQVKPEDVQVEEEMQQPVKAEYLAWTAAATEAEATATASAERQQGLAFAKLNLYRILKDGALLFSSTGDEYTVDSNTNVEQQREQLRKDLGLDSRIGSSVNDDMLGLQDDDLVTTSKPNVKVELRENETKLEDLVKDGNLSSRERNRLKREMKKQRARAQESSGNLSAGMAKRRTLTQFIESSSSRNKQDRTDSDFCELPSDGFISQQIADSMYNESEAFEIYPSEEDENLWVFHSTLEFLKDGVLDPSWETRHGSALGLKEILARHSTSAGKKSSDPVVAAMENQAWLEDISCRLLCVLALDRFNDFVGDTVVAPVRETAAMAIGAAAKSMDQPKLEELLQLVALFLDRKSKFRWEVRHAGLLALKYLLAVRSDLAGSLLNTYLPLLKDGLQDEDDDVRAVAADCFVPIAPRAATLFIDQIPKLMDILWEVLLDLDDLSASTVSVLELLTTFAKLPSPSGVLPLWTSPLKEYTDLYGDDEQDGTFNDSGQFLSDLLAERIPRLMAFFRHASVRVRRASSSCFEAILAGVSDELHLRWLTRLYETILDHVYRAILLEFDSATLTSCKNIWNRILPMLSADPSAHINLVNTITKKLPFWISLACHESRSEALQFDKSSGLSLAAKAKQSHAENQKKKMFASKQSKIPLSEKITDHTNVHTEGPDEGLDMQLVAAEALGAVALHWPRNNPLLSDAIEALLKSEYALRRRIGCDIVRNILVHFSKCNNTNPPLKESVFSITNEMVEFCTSEPLVAELGRATGSMFHDILGIWKLYNDGFQHQAVEAWNTCGIDPSQIHQLSQFALAVVKENDVVQASQIIGNLQAGVTTMMTTMFDLYQRQASSASPKDRQVVSTLRLRVLAALGFLRLRKTAYLLALSADAASVLVHMESELPKAVGSLIKALLNGVRGLDSLPLQRLASQAVGLLAYKLRTRPLPNKPLALMTKNLCKFVTVAQRSIQAAEAVANILPPGSSTSQALTNAEKEGSSGGSNKAEGEDLKAVRIELRGVGFALRAICHQFGPLLIKDLVWLWELVEVPILSLIRDQDTVQRVCGVEPGTNVSADDIIDAMYIVQIIISAIDSLLHTQCCNLLRGVIQGTANPNEQLRLAAGKTLGMILEAMPNKGMPVVIQDMIPLLGSDMDDQARTGAASALETVVQVMDLKLIPYAAFLIIPMMARMVDQCEPVRNSASAVFANLIRMLPLEQGKTADDPELSVSMRKEREKARQFLGKLTGTIPRTKYEMLIPVSGGVELRHYQQDCLDWLAFLSEYDLHGALCDDMGLGKTLMTLCIVANETFKYKQKNESGRFPSLVVCPATLVAHWYHETRRFFDPVLGSVLMYYGSSAERAKLRNNIGTTVLGEASDLVVTSYEVLGSDLEYFASTRWNYLVLDEGHVIKNVNTKASKAVRAISAGHRLLLSGTPIQNSVMELWAIFDFLMPGFLGTAKEFRSRYGKPISASRDPKSTDKEREAGTLAMESLHKQVLPFILRRLKDDVLVELPPKIIQDYYCDMNPLQMQLYEDFSNHMIQSGFQASAIAENMDEVMELDDGMGSGKKSENHVFQALQYLRKLCSHPKLVLKPSHPKYNEVIRELKARNASLSDLDISPKLLSLREVLVDCGIGTIENGPNNFGFAQASPLGDFDAMIDRNSGGHRALIFAQMKTMLDIVENDLFRKHMPGVSYLRLDGDVELTKRHGVVTRFNADPTIDVLLLTTHVGGLGLNLTGADTVIFLEHDWNPAKDLQAMDRAHRLGQKRTVNVYRLITRGTLEEKVLGLQRFKTLLANSIVNKSNSSLSTMNTSELLGLFKLEKGAATSAGSDMGKDSMYGGTGITSGLGMVETNTNVDPSVIEQFEQIAQQEDTDYSSEFNLDQYLNILNQSR